jgi:hypothetical protein
MHDGMLPLAHNALARFLHAIIRRVSCFPHPPNTMRGCETSAVADPDIESIHDHVTNVFYHLRIRAFLPLLYRGLIMLY